MKTLLLALFLAVSIQAADTQIYFFPKRGCTEAVVENLEKAKQSGLVKPILSQVRRLQKHWLTPINAA